MQVEFLGLCGAGKTSIIKLISQQHIDEISVIKLSKWKKIDYYYSLVKLLINLQSKYPGSIFLLRTSFKWLFCKLAFRLCKLCRDNNNNKANQINIIADTGMLMPIISYAIEHNDDTTEIPIKELIECLPLPDIVIYVKVDWHIALSRYCNRERIAYHLQQTNLINKFSLADDLLIAMLELLKLKKINIIEIENNIYQSVDIKSLIDEIFSKMKES